MTLKQYGIAAAVGLLLFAAGSAVGYLAKPARTVEKTVEVRVADQEAIAAAVAFARSEWKRDEKVKTQIRTVYKDGKPVERVVYRDREANASGGAESSSASSSSASAHVEETKQAEKTTDARSRWALEARGAWGAAQAAPDQYGGEIQFRAFGPLWVGIGAEKTDKVRPTASVRVEFP